MVTKLENFLNLNRKSHHEMKSGSGTVLIAIVLLLFFCEMSSAFENKERLGFSFRYFGVSDGLPSNEINRIGQDSLGFLWCATNNGLVRFDGYRFSEYRSDYADPDFFPGNIVRDMSDYGDYGLCLVASGHALIFDKRGARTQEIGDSIVPDMRPKVIAATGKDKVMIGGEGGCVIYDTGTGKLSGYLECEGERLRYIREIYKDRDGNIWIGTWMRGIYVIEAGSASVSRFSYHGIPERVTVTMFFEDRAGNFYICTWGDGLFCLRNRTSGAGEMISYVHDKRDSRHLDWNIIYDIDVDENGYVWAGTPGGLRILRMEKASFTVLDYVNLETGKAENFQEVMSVFKDKDGNMWLSDYGKGLVLADYGHKGIREIDPRDDGSKFSAVTAIYKDGDILWIGIRGQNFIRYDMVSGRILDDSRLMRRFDEDCNAVVSFVPVPEKDLLFLSTRYAGVYMLEMDSGAVSGIRHFDTGQEGIRSSFTNAAARDAGGNIWVGTNSGLVILENGPEGYEVKVPEYLNMKLGGCVVETVYPDSGSNIWVGSANNGLFRFRYDLETGEAEDLRCYNVENGLMSNDRIQTVFEDSEGRIWTGTNGGGCYLYDREEDSFHIVHNMDLFPSDQIFALAEDREGKLWISTGKGLSCYDPDNAGGSLWNIGIDIGLKNLSFIKNAVWSEPGLIIFGGYDGLSLLDTGDISQKGTAPVSSIVDVQIFNRSLDMFPEEERLKVTDKLPPYSDRITLGHKDLSVSFTFVAPTFRNEDLVKYAYRLSGLEKEWNYVGAGQRSVTYSYLKPGSYRFEVTAESAIDRQVSEPAYIDLTVRPAPWLTFWAKLGYIVVLAGAGTGIYFTVRNRERLRQALRLEQMERLKSDEVNNAKLMFFTNVSHELFTPITVMSCSLEKLIEKEPHNFALHKIMRSNLNRLMRLLQQIMEFRKSESSNLKLKVSEMDIVPFVKKMCDENFSPLEVDKNIRMIFSSEHEHLSGYIDPDKLDKILYNLISNAYKYNRPDGKVFVRISDEVTDAGHSAVIQVKDTGYGIEKDRIGDLFKRFYEGDYRKFRTKGTGIGLSLTKDLVDLHKGTINVDSVEGEGTVFTVRIPLDKEAYSPDQIDSGVIYPASGEDAGAAAEALHSGPGEQSFSLLVAEDNEDLLMVMKNILEPKYRIFTAKDGKQALEILRKEAVSLVITDYVMPVMGGLELCRKIRADLSLSHIPVIMLSARTARENKLRAFDAGVDAYITKPFEVKLLIAQVDGILANRSRLYTKFRSGENAETDLLISTDMDRQFVENTIRVIENHISDPDFGIEAFNAEMNMSNSTLYRKIKGVTGMSPKEFIRNIRFKYACRLLLEKTTSVADVAFMVGFTDAKYFSLTFKKEFGLTPSQYIAEHKKKAGQDKNSGSGQDN